MGRIIRRGLASAIQYRGRSRYQDMEDSYYFSGREKVFAVADGMGGRKGGRVASSLAAETLGSMLGSLPEWGSHEEYLSAMEKAFREANRRVVERGREPEYEGMGTTLAAALLRRDWMYVASVGDSRVYRLDVNGRLDRLTVDDRQMQEALDSHYLTLMDMLQDPRSGILTRWIGKETDLEAEVGRYSLEETRKILLVTDGLTDMATDRELRERLLNPQHPTETSRELIALASKPREVARIAAELSKKSGEGWEYEQAQEMIGGRDNATVIAISLET